MLTLNQAVNAPETVTVAGREFLVSQLTLKEWGSLQAWILKHVPSPLARAGRALADAAGIPGYEGGALVDILLGHADRAELGWPPRVGSYDWFLLLEEAEGGPAEFLRVALGKHQAIAATEAVVLAGPPDKGGATQEEYREVLRVALYGEPPPPKSPAAPETTLPGANGAAPGVAPTTGATTSTS